MARTPEQLRVADAAYKRQRAIRDPVWAAKEKARKRAYHERMRTSDPTWHSKERARRRHSARIKRAVDPVTTKRRWMLKSSRIRARAKGLPFTISLDDIPSPLVCPALGIKIDWDSRNSSGPASPSLDRLRPERGYVPGNVRVISHRANSIKNDATPTELARISVWLTTELDNADE